MKRKGILNKDQSSIDDANIWYNKAVSLFKSARYNEAIECYDKTLSIKSDYEV